MRTEGKGMTMARLQPIIRGAQDCRTLSTAANQTFLPHRTYLRVACLEMEKFRRTQERTSAMRRVENIDRRFGEIDVERDRLLSAMGECAPPSGCRTGAGRRPREASRARARADSDSGIEAGCHAFAPLRKHGLPGGRRTCFRKGAKAWHPRDQE